MSIKSVQVGLIGLGVVGGGTYAVLKKNQAEIERRVGRKIEINMVAVRNTTKAIGVVDENVRLVNDAIEIIQNPDIDIVVELIGGDKEAKEYVMAAIENGKHIVTANKALLAKHGTEIFAAAAKKGVIVAFEGAVAGGIPIIKSLREGLTANKIFWVAGIINGTSNFILSEMRDKGIDFDVALKDAQRLGYAETDPTFDIEGIDAAHKLTLMASIAFGIPIQFEKVYVEGITQLNSQDIKYAERLGYRIKLLGIARWSEKGVELRVHPTLIPKKRLIANVEGAMNAIEVQGNAVGTSLYYGKGAGAEPTASSVIADLIDIARLQSTAAKDRVPSLAFHPHAILDTPILAINEVVTSYYLRLRVADQCGVLAKVASILAESNISVDTILQREAQDIAKEDEREQTELIILTHECFEKNMNSALEQMQQLPTVLAKIIRLRKEELA